MKKLLLLILIFVSLSGFSQKKIDSIPASQTIKLPGDSIEIISISDIKILMQALENQYTKHDYDKVNEAIGYLINVAMQRRLKKK